MGKFNENKVCDKPTVVNEMGEMAYKFKAIEELVSTVLTTFISDGYYEKESDIVDRIKNCIDCVDPLFAAKLAVYARTNANMRSVSHLMAAYLASKVVGCEWAKNFYRKVCVRPDDMTEILSCYAALNGMGNEKIRKLPNSMKKGFSDFLSSLDPYRIDKYKMGNKKLKLVDLVNLLHPCPTSENSEAYKRLLEGKSLEGLYQSRVLEKEMSKAGELAETEDEKDELKADVIRKTLSNVKGMPIFNLLRNLRNIMLYAPDQVEEACRQLRIEDKILNSRVLPFRFATD